MIGKFLKIFALNGFLTFYLHAESDSTDPVAPMILPEMKNEWLVAIKSELENPSIDLLNRDVNTEDLKQLNCLGDMTLSPKEERLKFWQLFLASLVRAESRFVAHASSGNKSSRAYGLLQMQLATARTHCSKLLDHKIEKKHLIDPEFNLRCGVHLLNWQVNGAPLYKKNGEMLKKLRPDFTNKLFAVGILLWGPLRSRDYSGRKRIYQYFEKYKNNISFCSQ